MKQRDSLERVENGIRIALARFGPIGRAGTPSEPVRKVNAVLSPDVTPIEVPREFHRRIAAIIEAVQTGIWLKGVHELLGYTTDFALGQERGVQTLVLKTRHRSAYARLDWDTVMGDSSVARQRVTDAVESAIRELA
jgi:hypothetical protein